MVFLLGLDLPAFKRVDFAIRKFKGIGPFLATKICDQASVHRLCKMKDLTAIQTGKLKSLIATKLEEERQAKLAQMKLAKRAKM